MRISAVLVTLSVTYRKKRRVHLVSRLASLSANVRGKTRSQRSGSRVIWASELPLGTCFITSTVCFRPVDRPYLRISAYISETGQSSGSKSNPMTVYALPRPASDLVLAVRDVGKMSRLQLSQKLIPACLVSLRPPPGFV